MPVPVLDSYPASFKSTSYVGTSQTAHKPLLLQVNPQHQASHVTVINISTLQVSKHHQVA